MTKNLNAARLFAGHRKLCRQSSQNVLLGFLSSAFCAPVGYTSPDVCFRSFFLSKELAGTTEVTNKYLPVRLVAKPCPNHDHFSHIGLEITSAALP